MSQIIEYVKTRDGRIHPIIKETICNDPNGIHDGLCYVMPNGYAIDSENVIRVGKTIEDLK